METSPYAYAKACGIIGKSFVGKRISSLAGIRSLSELERLVFPNFHRELPQREMLADLEKRITKRSVRQNMAIVGSFANPPELLTRMIRTYEYSDLKVCLSHIAGGKKEPPDICDIGRFGTVNFAAFPDLNKMLLKTEFEPMLSAELKNLKAGADLAPVEAKIDSLYYNGLIKSLSKISAEDRELVQKILADEIALRNCTWALRLRSYYNKLPTEIVKYLTDIKIRGVSLAADARASLDFQLDARVSWNGWKWEEFLNPSAYSSHWTADPRYFQNAASNYLYRLALKNFHRYPMSISEVFCFIKLEQFEEDLLTSIAEGLSLGMDSTGVFKMLEVA